MNSDIFFCIILNHLKVYYLKIGLHFTLKMSSYCTAQLDFLKQAMKSQTETSLYFLL